MLGQRTSIKGEKKINLKLLSICYILIKLYDQSKIVGK